MALVFSSFWEVLLALAIVAIIGAVIFVRHRYTHWQRKHVPYIAPTFPFGNFTNTFMQKCSFADRLLDLYNELNEPFVGTYNALTPSLLIRDPDLMRTIMVKEFHKFQDRGGYIDEKNDPLSAHLFALPGEKWRYLRQKLTPTFTSGKLKAMFQTIVDSAVPLSTHMINKADENSIVEVRELLAQFTTNVIASVAFGLEIDCISNPDQAFRRFGRKVFAPTFSNGFRDMLGFFFPSLFAKLGLKSFDQDVEDFFMSVVRQNMELREKHGTTRKDFFQLLVQLRNNGIQADGDWETKISEGDKKLSIEECAAQSFVFYLAGFETSSTTASFALYELARNPKCQQRVQQEIDEVLTRHNNQITYESVGEMKYLEMCIDETLRQYPPLPMLNRECNETWTIPASGGITIDAGTMIIIPAYAIQRDPKYYPEPNSFIPERFETPKPFIEQPYMPFGEGPRNCIGLRLGKIQTKIALISMLQKFKYELAGNTLKPLVLSPSQFLLTPKGGINLRVTHRSKHEDI